MAAAVVGGQVHHHTAVHFNVSAVDGHSVARFFDENQEPHQPKCEESDTP